MTRLLYAAFALAALTSTAVGAPAAKAPPKDPPPPIQVPAVGANLDLSGTSWPKVDYLYDAPSPKDAAGKVIVHWFCAPKVAACADDLARIIALRDAGRVYIIAYINGTKADAKKLDPIRESEGVGRGTVAYGPGVAKLTKALGFTGDTSVVVGPDQKVGLVGPTGAPDQLDARDKLVTSLAGGIKDYVVTKNGPSGGKAGQPFTIELVVSLASWLKFGNLPEPAQMSITVPKDIKCDATTLAGDKLVITGQTLTGTAHCTAPRGSYEARAEIRFGYSGLDGAAGIGTDAGDWKFTITP